ncbi:MAG: VCBS repeat-containing protein [Bacteroidia bacterium]
MKRILILFFSLVILISSVHAQYDPFESLGDNGFGYFNKDYISADLDNNGENEILISDYGKWVLWRKAPNTNNHILVAEYSCGYEASHVKTVVRDLDGDGLKDIVMAYIIHRDSSTGPLSRISLNPDPVATNNSGPAPGPIPPPPPPPPIFCAGNCSGPQKSWRYGICPPKRLAQNLGYIMDMQVGNLDSTNELQIITSSVYADSNC